MNSQVTTLPGLVPIFVSAGGVNALAGVLFNETCCHQFQLNEVDISVNIIWLILTILRVLNWEDPISIFQKKSLTKSHYFSAQILSFQWSSCSNFIPVLC